MLVRDVSRQVALETMRKDFVANASHELRSPLTVMTGYLETLLSDAAARPGAARAAARDAAPDPAHERHRQRPARPVAPRCRRPPRCEGEPIDVGALCARAAQGRARPAAASAGAAWSIDTDARLLGDEPEILSAFSNLVDNAAKYTPESRLASGCAGGWTRRRSTLLGDRHRARASRRSTCRASPNASIGSMLAARARPAASGLGLAIVKHVLQHHGATLEIESTPGEGSTFTCAFPARRVRAGAAISARHSTAITRPASTPADSRQ